MVASPSEQDFQAMVRLNMLKDYPVTNAIDDIINAHNIYGPDLASIRGKTVRRKPEHVPTDYVDIPRNIIWLHQQVTLSADIMFVNRVPFLFSVLRNINLIMIENASRRTASQLGHLLQRIIRVYVRAGFHLRTILMDNKFNKVRDHIPEINMNTPAAAEHVGEIEHKIWVIYEQARGIICTLPYKQLPLIMMIHLMHSVVMRLNNFPVSNGISSTYSPHKIVLRHRLDYNHHCRAPFEAYCKTHKDNTPTNNMTTQGCPAICLGLMGNIQGTYNFLNLVTGLVIKRRSFGRAISLKHKVIISNNLSLRII